MGTMVCMVSLFGIGGLGLGVWAFGRARTHQARGTALLASVESAHPPVTRTSIEPPPGMVLSDTETALLSTLFARYARLVIEREFLSGYSGARTFLAVPIRPDSRVDARTIIKIADQRSVQQEFENYENYG